MSATASVLTILALGSLVAWPAALADDGNAYLTEKDGKKELKAPFTVREEQSGFVGTTGTAFTIEPDGRWRVERFRPGGGGKENVTPVRSGTLSQAQLEGLAKAFADHDLTGLAEKVGREPKVNPHRITIKYGQKTSKLEGLPPRKGSASLAEQIRAASPEDEKESKAWQQFAGLVHAAEQHCQESKDL